MTTKKVLLEIDITKEQQEKLDKLSEKWGLSESDTISKIIDKEGISLIENQMENRDILQNSKNFS